MNKYSAQDISEITKGILKETPIEKSLYVYSRALLHERLNHISEVFPQGTHHAVAIKSNSHPAVLEEIVTHGCGLEAASYEEVELAVAAGCPAERIVFDSPVKTVRELETCNREHARMIVNANCFKELHRVVQMKRLRVGIRINPLVDPGSPGIYNVSGTSSKFGIPITQRSRIVEYALGMANVKGLHIHAGSEIGSRDNHVEAIGAVISVAEEVRSRGKKLDFIDIGGGIPASEGSLTKFFTTLTSLHPKILDYQIITEYGRFVQQHCAFVLSRVEYVLDHADPEIALIHVGADLFPREVYSSVPPKHDFHVLDDEGSLKQGEMRPYDIGGPLCFSGDFLARGMNMPMLQSGDLICITETGANTLSMWSRHCSRAEVEVKMVD